jgi:flagellar hook-associated protein FlgK
MSVAVKTSGDNIAAAEGTIIKSAKDIIIQHNDTYPASGDTVNVTQGLYLTGFDSQYYDIQADTFKLEYKDSNGEWQVLDPKYYSLDTQTGQVKWVNYSAPPLTPALPSPPVGQFRVNFFDPSKTTAWTIELSVALKTSGDNIAAAKGTIIESAKDIIIQHNDTYPATGDTVNVTQGLYLTGFDSHYFDIQADTFKLEYWDNSKTPPDWTVLDPSHYSLDTQTGQVKWVNYSAPPLTPAPPPTPPTPPVGQFRVNFDYQTSGFPGSGNAANATAIAALRDKVMVEGSTMGTYYSSVLNRVGNEKNQAEAGLDTRTAARQALLNRQQEVSGVNMDEETANLIQYQATYQACARYFTTITDMLDVLLNM